MSFENFTVNVNGRISRGDEATISVFDRGFLFGDSVYEVTYSQERTLLFFKEHLGRLEKSATALGIDFLKVEERITQETLKTLHASKLDQAYVRIVLTRGFSEPNINSSGIELETNFVIMVKEQVPYPSSLYTNGIELCISDIKRNHPGALDPNIKSGNYLNNILALRQARERGFMDAIMVNHEGFVTEGTTFNVWIVKNQKLYTAPVSSGLLKGITRDEVIKIAKEVGIAFQEKLYTPSIMEEASEVFITSSTKGIVPVSRIDDIYFNDFKEENSITKKLLQEYQRRVREHFEKKEFSY